MKVNLLSSAGREIAQWRRFFHARVSGDDDSRPPRHANAGDTVLEAGHSAFDPTEWSNTDWSDTQAESLALSAPIDTTETSR
jgi:hypothetical protein